MLYKLLKFFWTIYYNSDFYISFIILHLDIAFFELFLKKLYLSKIMFLNFSMIVACLSKKIIKQNIINNSIFEELKIFSSINNFDIFT